MTTNSTSSEKDDDSIVVTIPEMYKFVVNCFQATGLSRAHSYVMAESIIGADMMGHHSHGVFKLNRFVMDTHLGYIDVKATPKIESETSATAWVDGQNALGPVVGNFCMKIAIQKAKQVGAAIVVAKCSNNCGVAAQYTRQALKEELIGMAFSNSSPLMVPTRGKYSILGTNPMSMAAPAMFKDFFLLDMATTVTSGGNIQLHGLNKKPLPVGYALNRACLPETDPEVAISTGRFNPLGSQEITGSYKGTGLAMMVDILSGVLGGAFYGNSIEKWGYSLSGEVRAANIGHCFIVIDPKVFASDFQYRLSDLLNLIRGMEPLDPKDPVRTPGDKCKLIKKKIEEDGGLRYKKSVHKTLNELAEMIKINPVKIVQPKKVEKVTSSEEMETVPQETESKSLEETILDDTDIVTRITSMM